MLLQGQVCAGRLARLQGQILIKLEMHDLVYSPRGSMCNTQFRKSRPPGTQPTMAQFMMESCCFAFPADMSLSRVGTAWQSFKYFLRFNPPVRVQQQAESTSQPCRLFAISCECFMPPCKFVEQLLVLVTCWVESNHILVWRVCKGKDRGCKPQHLQLHQNCNEEGNCSGAIVVYVFCGVMLLGYSHLERPRLVDHWGVTLTTHHDMVV